MELEDIVMKLNGPIGPVGETSADEKRFENLKSLHDLVNKLMQRIYQVSQEKTSREFSVKRSGEYAEEALKALAEWAEEDNTYDGDDPRQDQESVARCRENWGGTWPG